MSGLAAAFAVPGAADRLRSLGGHESLFSGPSHDRQSYVEDGVAIVVAGRFPRAALAGSYAELVDAPHHVIAIDGYVHRDPPDAAGGGPTRAEVLLQRFVRDGAPALRRLAGAYTLVIWDKLARRATFAVSAFGQRLLYSRTVGPGLVVASDLAALRFLSGPLSLDPDTVWMSLLYGGVFGAATPFDGVAKILPGSVATAGPEGLAETPALDLGGRPPTPARGTGQHLDQLDAAFRGALGRLAGVGHSHALMIGSGVDSSLVAAYARHTVPALTAVTQQMPGELDESAAARRIAAAFGIPHRVVPYRVEDRRLLHDVARFVRIAEEPAYWNQLGPALLSLIESLPHPPQAFLTGAEGDFLFNYRTGPVSLVRVLRHGLFRPVAAHVARRLLNRITRHTYIVGADFDLLDRDLMRQHMATCPDVARGPYYVHEYAHLPGGANAQRHFLNNGWQNVRIISQFARAVGAEALFPYMDDEVVAAVRSLPDEMKINKVALRLLLTRFLPAPMVPAKKTGYWAHTIRWYDERGSLGDVLDLLTDRRTAERGVYDRPALEALTRAYAAKAAGPRHHPVLWQLLLFEMFCRELVDAR